MFDAINISAYFSKTTIWLSVLTGWVLGVLGGYDPLIKTLIGLTIFDFLTGVGSSLYSGKGVSSEYGFKGVIKKVFIYLTIAVAVVIEKALGGAVPLREIVITFYIMNEGISNLENIGKVITYPAQLKDALTALRGD